MKIESIVSKLKSRLSHLIILISLALEKIQFKYLKFHL